MCVGVLQGFQDSQCLVPLLLSGYSKPSRPGVKCLSKNVVSINELKDPFFDRMTCIAAPGWSWAQTPPSVNDWEFSRTRTVPASMIAVYTWESIIRQPYNSLGLLYS